MRGLWQALAIAAAIWIDVVAIGYGTWWAARNVSLALVLGAWLYVMLVLCVWPSCRHGKGCEE